MINAITSALSFGRKDGLVSSMGAQSFEFTIAGDQDLAIGCQLSGGALKQPIAQGLLEPFLQKIMDDLKIQVACTHIQINGVDQTNSDLLRPISEFCVPGDACQIKLWVHALDKVAAARAAQLRSPSGGRAKVGFGTEPSLVGENYDAVGASKPKPRSPGSPVSPVLGKVGSFKKGQAMSYSMFALDAIMIQPVVAPVMSTIAVDSTRSEPSDGFSSRSEDPVPPPPPPPPPPPLVALEEPPPPPPPPPEDEPLI